MVAWLASLLAPGFGQTSENTTLKNEIVPIEKCFEGIRPKIISFDYAAAELTFYRGGTLKCASTLNEYAEKDGWTIQFADNQGKKPSYVIAAQLFEKGKPSGAFFYWPSAWGGSNHPYAYGVWKNGTAMRGIFLTKQGTPVAMGSSVDTMVYDEKPSLIKVLGGEQTGVADSDSDASLESIKADAELLEAFSQLKYVAIRCCDLKVADTSQGESP